MLSSAQASRAGLFAREWRRKPLESHETRPKMAAPFRVLRGPRIEFANEVLAARSRRLAAFSAVLRRGFTMGPAARVH